MTGFSSLLVANRGEIARRVMRTAREMGLRTVAVFSDADADTPFTAEADEAVRLPGGYFEGQAVIAAAHAAGAQAVHPGYGFLAENAEFARAVIEAGLVWVGPSPGAIAEMGDKITAKRAAAAAGVPTLASTRDPEAADKVGFPLMVKAAAGGGGRGMRLVESADGLPGAVAAARREALAGFGDDTVFFEQWLRRCRHIEIQVLGDSFGNVVHLGERECSIQRRHQKLIEESPSTAVSAELRSAMGASAAALARAIGYSSAGTVELLLDEDTGEFSFLEMNTRLQVEHPVTEAVTGIDLVREQLRIAAGESLGYEQSDVTFDGHAIEARLCAEDPANDFLPAAGTLAAFEPAAAPDVRWDSGVAPGSVIGIEFDSMLAKVIAHAPARDEAAARLALALERLHLGGVTTNRHFLVTALRSEAFLAGDTTTDFIKRVDPPRVPALSPACRAQAAVAVAMWLQADDRRRAPRLAWLPSGWRHGRLPPERVELIVEGEPLTVAHSPRRDGSFAVTVTSEPSETSGESAGSPVGAAEAPVRSAAIVHCDDRGIRLECDGRRVGWRVTRWRDDVFLTAGAETVTARVLPRFRPPGRGQDSGGFAAPMPGVVLEVRAEPGETVCAGQTLVVLEGMKMEHRVKAATDGVVSEILVAVGDQVDSGAALLVFNASSDGGKARPN